MILLSFAVNKNRHLRPPDVSVVYRCPCSENHNLIISQ